MTAIHNLTGRGMSGETWVGINLAIAWWVFSCVCMCVCVRNMYVICNCLARNTTSAAKRERG